MTAPHPNIDAKIQSVQNRCSEPNYAEAATNLTTARLDALRRVLVPVGRLVDPSLLQQLGRALDDIESTVNKVLSTNMNPAVYLVKAIQVQQDLQHGLENLSSCLESLLTALPSEDQQQLRMTVNEYYTICDNQLLQFKALETVLETEQQQLAHCQGDGELSALLSHYFGSGLSSDDLSDALRTLQQDLHVLTGDLLSSDYLSGDPKARGEAIQYQDYLRTIVRRLHAHQKGTPQKTVSSGAVLIMEDDEDDETEDALFPDWALDPLTRRVMTHPVTIRAACEHTVDKSSFIVWLNQGNKVCPVCQGQLKGMSAKPNKELAESIRSLTSATSFRNSKTKGDLNLAELKVDSTKIRQRRSDSAAMNDSTTSVFSMMSIQEEEDLGDNHETIPPPHHHRVGSADSDLASAAHNLNYDSPPRSPTSSPHRAGRMQRQGLACKINVTFGTSPIMNNTAQRIYRKRPKQQESPTIKLSSHRPRVNKTPQRIYWKRQTGSPRRPKQLESPTNKQWNQNLKGVKRLLRAVKQKAATGAVVP